MGSKKKTGRKPFRRGKVKLPTPAEKRRAREAARRAAEVEQARNDQAASDARTRDPRLQIVGEYTGPRHYREEVSQADGAGE